MNNKRKMTKEKAKIEYQKSQQTNKNEYYNNNRASFSPGCCLIYDLLFLQNIELNEYGVVVGALVTGAYAEALNYEIVLRYEAEVDYASAREGVCGSGGFCDVSGVLVAPFKHFRITLRRRSNVEVACEVYGHIAVLVEYVAC